MYFDYRLWQMMAGLRAGMAGGVVLGLLALGAGIARFVFLGWLLAGVFRGEAWSDLLPSIAGVAAMVLLRAALDHLRAVQAHRSAIAAQHVLRAKLYDRIVSLGPAWFANQRTGGIMLSVVDGVEQLETFFGTYLPQVAIAAVAPFAIFAVIAWWDLPVACVLLVAALFSLFAPMAVHMLDRRASLARSQAMSAFGERFLDAVQGLPTLKSFGQGKTWGRRLAERARALSDQTFWVLSVSLLTRGAADLGIALGAALALTLGAWRVVDGQMSVEALLIVLMAGTEIFRPLRDLRSVLHRGMLGQSAADGIHAILQAQPDLPPAGTTRAASLTPTIAFNAVTFSYSGRRAAHRGLTFNVKAGERVAIVGPSGAGKSTIVRLLLREHDPESGSIVVGGHDLRALATGDLLAQIAIVAQDSTLFHGTIEDNLRLGKPDASAEALRNAARAANAHDFIMALPHGYDTRIGERGLQLSGGQRQRLAIARALLRDAPILILDEALSSVDTENEAVIQEALDRLMVGRTTLILAHRLASVIGADRTLVLDGGRVVEEGTHAELMQAQGLYHRLMHEQETVATSPDEPAPIDAIDPRAAVMDDAAGPHRAADRRPGRAGEFADGLGEEQGNPRASEQSNGQAHRYAGAQADERAGPVLRELDADAAQVGWRDTIATLLSVIAPWRGTLILTIVLGVARVAAFIGVGVLSALVVAAVRDGREIDTLIIALLITAPLAALFHWLESWLAHAMAYKLLADMRIALFDKLERLAPAYLLRRRSGDLVALATQDVEMVEYFYAHTVAPAIVSVLVPLSVLGFLAVFSWPLAIALLPFLGYAMLSPLRGRKRVDALGGEARSGLGALSAHITDTIQGLADIVAFQAEGRRRTEFLALAKHYGERRMRLLRDLSAQQAYFETATGLGGLAVAVLGTYLVTLGMLSAGMLPLLILIAVATFLPVSEISQVSRQLADTIAATRRLHVVSHEPEPVVDGPLAPAAPAGGSAIVFDDVGFTYPGRTQPALRHLRVDIAAGSTVALVGPSGAGKSTVAGMLMRFWDVQSGAVRLDGRDVRELELDGLRQRVALVAQDTYLFNDTLEANIRLARPDASAEDLAQALDHAALTAVVAQLPDGLATRVGERGAQLSGGQRQRIAIARAFLKNAPVLVLDEATSHLDTLSELQVRRALDKLMDGRTTLVIAHRLATIRHADMILVLKDGQLAESGRHDDLLLQNGLYAHLWHRQSVKTDEAAPLAAANRSDHEAIA